MDRLFVSFMRFNQQTVVNPDVEQAKILRMRGIQFIHVVDLTAALDGRATNRDLIAEVKKVSTWHRSWWRYPYLGADSHWFEVGIDRNYYRFNGLLKTLTSFGAAL